MPTKIATSRPGFSGGPQTAIPAKFSAEMYPAPIKGLDVRATLMQQDPATAVVLKNVICRRFGVELRLGYQRWVSNIPGEVRSLMSYLPPRGVASTFVPKLFAASSNGNIYDVTDPQSEVFVPPVALALPGQVDPGELSWTNFSTAAANFLVVCSAGVGVWTFDHVGGWVNRTGSINTAPVAGRAINFDFVMSWKNRLWFIDENTTTAFYLPPNSVQGNADRFEFGPLFVFGGDLKAMASWTLDAGNGIDDKLVIVSGGGGVLVYEGTDPASNFRIIGRWFAGKPTRGRRFLGKYGGDLTIITVNGIEKMSMLTQARGLVEPGTELGSGDPSFARYMEKIAQDIRITVDQPYWTLIQVPYQQCILVTTPHNISTDSLQYVYGSWSGGWSELVGIPMLSAEMHEGLLFFGTKQGTVHKAFFGATDDLLQDGTLGKTVVAEVQTAFVAMNNNNFNSKRPLMAMPMFLAPSPPSVKAQVNTDWSFASIAGSPVFNPAQLALWDIAKWDVAVWGGSGNFFQAWIGAEGLGTHASLRCAFSGGEGTILTSWKLASEIGKGIL